MANIYIRLNFNGGLVLKEILKYANENQFRSNYEHVCNCYEKFYKNEREQQKLKREKIEERLKNFKIHQDLR